METIEGQQQVSCSLSREPCGPLDRSLMMEGRVVFEQFDGVPYGVG